MSAPVPQPVVNALNIANGLTEPVFSGWPKTPRLFRDMIVTEKIDGTNAAIGVTSDGRVYAQSRKRIITPTKGGDNHGFAQWVYRHQVELRELLGEGLHFGEWYGQGIQHGYGLTEKRFALFNVKRWTPALYDAAADNTSLLAYTGQLETVPVIWEGPFSTGVVQGLVNELRRFGSRVRGAEGHEAEGVVVYHTAANQVFKVTVEDDQNPKSIAAGS
jgi:hypothetical protein